MEDISRIKAYQREVDRLNREIDRYKTALGGVAIVVIGGYLAWLLS